MASRGGGSDAESEIRLLLEERADAVRRRDLEGVVSATARDVVTFDALPPLYNRGAEVVRERAAGWLGGYSDGPGYEVRDVRVVVGGDVGFAHYLYRVTGVLSEGSSVDMWVRATVGLEKSADGWRIVHEHHSVPFDARSGLASLDLRP